jgi:hypothetical protein
VAVSVALVAGEVTQEKQRGMLAHLLATPMTPWHLLGGKLLAWGAQLLSLLWAGLPLFCFAAFVAGLSPAQVVGQAVVLALWVFALGAAALLASVRSRSTRGAALGLAVGLVGTVTALFGLRIGLSGLADWRAEPAVADAARALLVPLHLALAGLNPLALVYAIDGPELVRSLAATALVYGGVGGLCLLLAVRRLRPEYVLAQEAPTGRKGFWHPRPAPDVEPVRWRERYVLGLITGPLVRRLPRWLALTLVAVGSAAFNGYLFGVLARGPAALMTLTVEIFIICITAGVFLIAGLRGAEAITIERQAGTWEALLLTPLTDAELIRQKFRGINDTLTAAGMAFLVPGWLAALIVGVTPDWLLLLALYPVYLWFLQRFMVAVGLNFSAGSTNWASNVMGTMVVGVVVMGITHFGGLAATGSCCSLGMLREWLGGESVLMLLMWAGVTCGLLEWFGRLNLAAAIQELGSRDRPRRKPASYPRP